MGWVYGIIYTTHFFKNSFNEQQYSSLEDYIEASIMLQYNH